MASIALREIEKAFGRENVLDGIDLEIADGELFVLLGPSGSGKTTLLRIIAGLEEANGGSVWLGGRDVTKQRPRDRDVAVVFQNYALYPHLRVRDNLAFGLRRHRTDKRQINKRVAEVAKVLELDELLDRKPGQLSGGQQQRVALGRAIARQPSAFLMDEPLSNLDTNLRVAMRAAIAQLHDQLQTTTVYVTHDQVEAMTLGQRIGVMRRGALEQVGTPNDLYERPANAFIASFVGSPRMNIVQTKVESGGFVAFGGGHLPLNPLAATRLREGDSVLVGIRPIDLEAAEFARSAENPVVDVTVRVREYLGWATVLMFLVEDAQPISPVSEDEDAGARLEVMDVGHRSMMAAEVSPLSRAQVGQRARLSVDPERLYFFDVETEELIAGPSADSGQIVGGLQLDPRSLPTQ
jgi:multiple sugar transport system ATP-binding protein